MRLIFVVSVLLHLCSGRIFDKCELSRHFKTKYLISDDEADQLTCIAQFESTFNTAAVNEYNWDGSKDYGLFQINNRYWCGDDPNPGDQNYCQIPCEKFLDDDITDDLACVKLIRKEWVTHKPVTDGYLAWVAYRNECFGRDYKHYMSDCSQAAVDTNVITPVREAEKVGQKKPGKIPLPPVRTPSMTESIRKDKPSQTLPQSDTKRKPSSGVHQSSKPQKKPSSVQEGSESSVPTRASGSGVLVFVPTYKTLSPSTPPILTKSPNSRRKVAPPAVINFADPLWFRHV